MLDIYGRGSVKICPTANPRTRNVQPEVPPPQPHKMIEIKFDITEISRVVSILWSKYLGSKYTCFIMGVSFYHGPVSPLASNASWGGAPVDNYYHHYYYVLLFYRVQGTCTVNDIVLGSSSCKLSGKPKRDSTIHRLVGI